MGRLRKNCNDKRFHHVRDRYYRALGHYLKRGKIINISVARLSEQAGVWCSTFYDHFKNVEDALDQYCHCYDQEIENLRDEIIQDKLTLELAICKVLKFINKHKLYYTNHMRFQNPAPFYTIIKIFRPLLACTWSNYGREKYDLGFKIFSGEMLGVIYYWGDSEGFDEKKIVGHANYLHRLATNATRRLF